MKRFTFFLVALLVPCTVILAQDKTFGIKGGFAISNFWGGGTDRFNNQFRAVTPDLDEQNLYYFTVGFFNSRNLLPDFLAIQTELLYVRGGKNWEGTVGGDDFSFDLYADYIQMPWLVKITIPVLLRPRIYFGPYLSWMFRARVTGVPVELESAAFFEGVDVQGELFERYTNTIDVGMSAGLDFDVPFGPGNLVFDFRFNLGALDVFNIPEAKDVRNYVFLLSLGYSIEFGGYGY